MHKTRTFFLLSALLTGVFSVSLTSCSSTSSLRNDKYQITLINSDENMGDASTDIKEGLENEKVTLSVTSKNPNLYSVSSIEINEQKININYSGKYVFEIQNEDIKINVSFANRESLKEVSSLTLSESDPLQGKYSLSINGEDYSDESKSYSTGDKASVTPIPLNGYELKDIRNNGYLVLKDEEENYSLLLMSDNNIVVEFEESSSNSYSMFQSQYSKDYSSYDYVKEIAESNTDLGSLIDAVIKNTSKQKCVFQQSYAKATTKVAFITNNQVTRTSWIKNNDEVLKENITYSSNVKMAERAYLSEENVSYYRVKNDNLSDDKTVDYSSCEKDDMTYGSYYNTYHCNLNIPTPYLLDPSYLKSTSTIEKTEEGYSVSLDLDIDCMKIFRYYMITTTSDCDFSLAKQTAAPDFKSIHLNMTFDKSLRLQKTEDKEIYDVNTITGPASTSSESESSYSYPDTQTILLISEAITY